MALYLVAWKGVKAGFRTQEGRVIEAAPVCGPIVGRTFFEAFASLRQRRAWIEHWPVEPPGWPPEDELHPYQQVRH